MKKNKKRNIILLFIYLPIIYLAQTGPAGVLNSTNNVFWVKADTAVYNDAGVTLATNGKTIRQWNDYSGNGKNFGEATSTKQPTLVTNEINGFPVARFDGTDDQLSNLSITSGNTANFFVVLKYSALKSTNSGILQGSPTGLLLSGGAADKAIGMWISNANTPWGRGIQTDNSAKNIPPSITTTANTSYIIENQYNGTNINQYVNAAKSGSVTYNGSLKSWTEFAIGKQATEAWTGDIAEVIAFNTSINLAQRNIVNNYLSAKYNIAIAAASDFYAGDDASIGNYDFGVSGIGQASDGTTNLSFSPSAAEGLGITYKSGFDNGDYIFVGHNLKTKNSSIANDVGGMTGSENQRWARTWYIDVTNTSTVITSDIDFDMSDGGITGVTPDNAANYVLLQRASTAGDWAELITGATISGDVISFSNVTLTDGYYTIGTKNATSSPLPIELVDFSATCFANGVNLTWTTATETDNDYFLIESSANAIEWNEVAKIKGNGTTSQLNKYYHSDYKNYTDELIYYRLSQIDKNKKNTIFKAIDVNCNTISNNQMAAYPNPAINELNVLFILKTPTNGIIKITNSMGQTVLETAVKLTEGTNSFLLPIELNDGTYNIMLYSDNMTIPSQKLIIVK